MARFALSAAPRRCLSVLAAALLLPALVTAQAPPPGQAPGRGLSVTPYIGWATTTTRAETWGYIDGAGASVRDEVEMHLGSGVAAGLDLQLPLTRLFSIVGGAAWIDRDDADFSINGGERWVYTGSRSVLARAGVALELREGADALTIRQLRTILYAAPFYLFEKPQAIASIADDELFESQGHFGISLGVGGEVPLAGDRVAVQFGLDDYFTFWNEDQLRRLPEWLQDPEGGSAVELQADPTHQWVLRAGLTIRLH